MFVTVAFTHFDISVKLEILLAVGEHFRGWLRTDREQLVT